jgi:hypothetical protein
MTVYNTGIESISMKSSRDPRPCLSAEPILQINQRGMGKT